MKKIYLTGIGPGELKYLTLQAVDVLKNVELFLVPLKKGRKEELLKIRKNIIEGIARDKPFRIIELPFPERRHSKDYEEGVQKWRNKKAEILRDAIENLMSDNETAALLLWGDPALYDGHIDIVRGLLEDGLDIEFEVIPGITSIQVLTADHKIPLNQIGESILITTGRRLRELKENTGSPKNRKIFRGNSDKINNVVVMLDNYETFNRFRDSGLYIYWGAYLGTPDEIVISGKLSEVADKITQTRREMKKKKGWIMETYVLRRR